jgi:hypothetical protein|tara:strand:- start:11 stop:193 length:183 start_codon:yes stop_codon:yes gene_type:complete
MGGIMTKIYDFNWYRIQKEETLRKSMGYSKELWDLMKDSGYDTHDEEDINKFFEDLEDLD